MGGCDGGVVTGGMNMTAAIFCTHETLSRPLLQNRFIKKVLTVFKNREHCSLNDKGETTQKVCKQMLSFLYATHCHDLF